MSAVPEERGGMVGHDSWLRRPKRREEGENKNKTFSIFQIAFDVDFELKLKSNFAQLKIYSLANNKLHAESMYATNQGSYFIFLFNVFCKNFNSLYEIDVRSINK